MHKNINIGWFPSIYWDRIACEVFCFRFSYFGIESWCIAEISYNWLPANVHAFVFPLARCNLYSSSGKVFSLFIYLKRGLQTQCLRRSCLIVVIIMFSFTLTPVNGCAKTLYFVNFFKFPTCLKHVCQSVVGINFDTIHQCQW